MNIATFKEMTRIKYENDRFKEYMEANDTVKKAFDKWLYREITHLYYKEIVEG